MKRFAFLFLVFIMVASSLDLQGKSYYNTASNNFGGLFPHPGMRMKGRYKAIEDDCLVEENATAATALTIDTMMITSTDYRYQLRFANLNNKQGKSMSIKNPMTREKTTLTQTQWGLVFNHNDEGNYFAIVLSCDNSAPYDDITDQRTMQISVIQRNSEGIHELAKEMLTKGVSLEDEMNTLCIDVNEKSVTVSIGKTELRQVLSTRVERPVGSVQVGYLVGPGARVAVERAVLTVENEKQVSPTTSWTLDALDEYLANSTDPLEGYWKYLDRDMEDVWLRLGGRYTLAMVQNGNGYDLIYIDGAQVKKSLWHAGMLKGHLTKTVFSGNYDATWIDATLEPIDNDVQATIENGIILTMYFPVFKSQVRFAKVLINQ